MDCYRQSGLIIPWLVIGRAIGNATLVVIFYSSTGSPKSASMK